MSRARGFSLETGVLGVRVILGRDFRERGEVGGMCGWMDARHYGVR
jgi:hypothetical protein